MSDARVLEIASSLPEADQIAIRRQLNRLLADPLFKNSRRYPKLLRFVVEHTLDGSGPELKERTLGVDVFERRADYDTGTDPIVRITAAEVRKRLAQYYSVPGREDEIRIVLPAGCYVPEFRLPTSTEPDSTLDTAIALPPIHLDVRRPVRWKFRLALWSVAACAIALAAALAWWASRAPVRALDTFWDPVLGKSESVLLSVGQRKEPKASVPQDSPPPASQITLAQLYYLQSENVALPDAIALAHLGGLMQSRHLRFSIRGATQTNLSDFRENPVILVGAFTNDWNRRLNSQLRFSFERRQSLYMIRDRLNPSQTTWSVDYETPYLNLTTDYALITRVVDPESDRLVVAAGGLGGYGTQAASEFLTEPAYMQKLLAVAPRDWKRKNVQIVLSARVINGSLGPPAIVSSVFW